MKRTSLAIALFITAPAIAVAAPNHGAARPGLVYVQSHAGQTDTDGILSPGERRNPNIDYDHSQRSAERHGDARVENPDNDAAARADRAMKDEERRRAEYDRERDQHYYDRDYDRDHDNDDYYGRGRYPF